MGPEPMPPALRAYLEVHHGAISAVAAREVLGLSGAVLARLCGAQVLVSVCRGGYVDAQRLASATPEQAHELRLRAVLASNGRYAASHQSAAVLFGLPLVREDLERVHVVRQSGSGHGRRRAAFTVHEDRPSEFGTLLGAPTVGPVDAVLGAMRLSGDISAQGVVDAALRRGVVTADQLRSRLGERWGPRVRQAIEHADPAAESLGESGLRTVLRWCGYAVQSQVSFRDEEGFIGRVDFYLPQLRVVVEFDGAVKYAGVDGKAALVREKRREDRLRARGLAVVRIVWADLAHPERIRDKIRRAARSVR